MDYFFPELIEIGENSIIGMDTMILTHEFLSDRFGHTDSCKLRPVVVEVLLPIPLL